MKFQIQFVVKGKDGHDVAVQINFGTQDYPVTVEMLGSLVSEILERGKVLVSPPMTVFPY